MPIAGGQSTKFFPPRPPNLVECLRTSPQWAEDGKNPIRLGGQATHLNATHRCLSGRLSFCRQAESLQEFLDSRFAFVQAPSRCQGSECMPIEVIMSDNPYQPPQTMTDLSDAGGADPKLDRTVIMLRQTKPWVRFISVMLFIGSALIVVAGLFMLVAKPLGFGAAVASFDAGFGAGMSGVSILAWPYFTLSRVYSCGGMPTGSNCLCVTDPLARWHLPWKHKNRSGSLPASSCWLL